MTDVTALAAALKFAQTIEICGFAEGIMPSQNASMNMAQAVLTLAAEREAALAFYEASVKTVYSSGRRAGLLELAEWCEKMGALAIGMAQQLKADGRLEQARTCWAESAAYTEAASHARAMAEEKEG